MPAQLGVKIDGRPAEMGVATEVDAGAHTIAFANLCGEVVEVVEARAGEHAKLGPEAFPNLPLARLRFQARSSDGSPLPATARVENTANGTSWSTADAEAWVPACPLRLTIASEGLGAFIEDVAFEPGGSHGVDVVLAPGPDVVRIHGGTFVSGPPAEKLAHYRETDFRHENVERQVATFDLDRTEVTVAQYQACVDAGACVETTQELVKLRFPSSQWLDECNSAHASPDHWTIARKAKPGKENHPINCVSMWEAERYCKWAGKRLPTNIEWEFAARSRKTEYMWPWGNDETSCRAHTSYWVDGSTLCPSRDETAEPCSYPEGNSEQGVCDLVGNLAEYVEFPPGDRRRGAYNHRGASYFGPSEVFDIGAERPASFDLEGSKQDRFKQESQVGFRCARDVEARGR